MSADPQEPQVIEVECPACEEPCAAEVGAVIDLGSSGGAWAALDISPAFISASGCQHFLDWVTSREENRG